MFAPLPTFEKISPISPTTFVIRKASWPKATWPKAPRPKASRPKASKYLFNMSRKVCN